MANQANITLLSVLDIGIHEASR